MTLDQRFNAIQDAQRELREMHDRLTSSIGGSGSGGGGVSDRVSRVEARIDKIADELSSVKENLATLTERIAHLPSKGFVVTALLASLAVIAALVAFAEKLQALVG